MLVPHCSQNKDIQVIWAKFMDIIGDLKLDFTSEEGILELQRNIKSWFEHFLKVYQAKDVTPYMHALYYHVPEFLSLYQNIAYYTKQGLKNTIIQLLKISSDPQIHRQNLQLHLKFFHPTSAPDMNQAPYLTPIGKSSSLFEERRAKHSQDLP